LLDYGSYLRKPIAVTAQFKAHIIFTVPKFGLQVQIKLERWENAFFLFCVAFRMRLCDGPIFRPRSSIKCLYIFKTWIRDTVEFLDLSFNTRREIIITEKFLHKYAFRSFLLEGLTLLKFCFLNVSNVGYGCLHVVRCGRLNLNIACTTQPNSHCF
jgi:hypothetical protein